MSILVTGGSGLLGFSLKSLLCSDNCVAFFPTRLELDITSRVSVEKYIFRVKPSVILHAAALTDVDLCEKLPHEAFKVNVLGTLNIARAAAEVGAHLILISTDYVFDGKKTQPYLESDACSPINIYGQSKYMAECICRELLTSWSIVRTSGLFGPGGNNFFNTILKRVALGKPTPVVTDQRVTITYCPDLAKALTLLATFPQQGIIHLFNYGQATWYQFAKYAVAKAKQNQTLISETTAAKLGRAAPRPACSALGTAYPSSQIFLLRPWQDALEDYIAQYANNLTDQ